MNDDFDVLEQAADAGHNSPSASEAVTRTTLPAAERPAASSSTRELTSLRGGDGTWHAHYRDATSTLCGVDVPAFKPGRRRLPTCATCLAAARALPVEQTPAFWGWRPVVAPPRPRVGGVVDPAVRADGTCVVCRKRRKPERSRNYARLQADVDPFCSTECCRDYHHVERRTRAVSGPVPRHREAA